MILSIPTPRTHWGSSPSRAGTGPPALSRCMRSPRRRGMQQTARISRLSAGTIPAISPCPSKMPRCSASKYKYDKDSKEPCMDDLQRDHVHRSRRADRPRQSGCYRPGRSRYIWTTGWVGRAGRIRISQHAGSCAAYRRPTQLSLWLGLMGLSAAGFAWFGASESHTRHVTWRADTGINNQWRRAVSYRPASFVLGGFA